MNTTEPTAFVFAPSPLLTVTVEHGRRGDEIHLHPGGQGVWLARMLVVLGVPTSLCGTFGGEAGRVVCALIANEGINASAINTPGPNGVYIHDRRNGERVPVAQTPADVLRRHELDEFYGRAFVGGLDADVCLLGGPPEPEVLPPSIYERLAGDLTANGKTVVADLSGDDLKAVIAGGVTVLKVSDEELLAGGWLEDTDTPAIAEAMESLAAAGAANVVVSRADRHAIARLHDGRVIEAAGPRLRPIDSRGAGDSMTAGIAAALARGNTIEDGLRLGVAAGSLNVTRRGLATGNRVDIERLASHVTIKEVAQR